MLILILKIVGGVILFVAVLAFTVCKFYGWMMEGGM